jgi:ParB-like chromosome segregation protein Spo0J
MDLVFAPSQIESWPIDRLRPYARNAKIHGTDQVAKIAASMAKFGWTVPCMVADDGELIAGHGRVLAAAMLGLKDVPVIRLSHLDEAERRAYRIADNKLTELGEWDEAMLRDEIAGLLAEDFDLSLLGITDEDLDALLRDPDQVEGGTVDGEDECLNRQNGRSIASHRPRQTCAHLGAGLSALSPTLRGFGRYPEIHRRGCDETD